MRVFLNGMCDPTLHLIAIALLLAGMISLIDRNEFSRGESGPIKRCRVCVSFHDDADAPCTRPQLKVASQNFTD